MSGDDGTALSDSDIVNDVRRLLLPGMIGEGMDIKHLLVLEQFFGVNGEEEIGFLRSPGQSDPNPLSLKSYFLGLVVLSSATSTLELVRSPPEGAVGELLKSDSFPSSDLN